MSYNEVIEDDIRFFQFLLTEYANADDSALTQDAIELKRKLVKILHDNGWE